MLTDKRAPASREEPNSPESHTSGREHRAGVRASDRERQHVVELLRDAAAEGRLTLDELEQRTDAALRARTREELDGLGCDLPLASARAGG